MKWHDIKTKPPKSKPFLAHTTLPCNDSPGNIHVCWWNYSTDRFVIGIFNNCEYCGGLAENKEDFRILRWTEIPDQFHLEDD